MVTVKCIQKIRDRNHKIYGYRLIDFNGRARDVSSDELKQAIRNGAVNVVNLTLTSDNRLIDSSEETSKSDYSSLGTPAFGMAKDKKGDAYYNKPKQYRDYWEEDNLKYEVLGELMKALKENKFSRVATRKYKRRIELSDGGGTNILHEYCFFVWAEAWIGHTITAISHGPAILTITIDVTLKNKHIKTLYKCRIGEFELRTDVFKERNDKVIHEIARWSHLLANGIDIDHDAEFDYFVKVREGLVSREDAELDNIVRFLIKCPKVEETEGEHTEQDIRNAVKEYLERRRIESLLEEKRVKKMVEESLQEYRKNSKNNLAESMDNKQKADEPIQPINKPVEEPKQVIEDNEAAIEKTTREKRFNLKNFFFKK